MRLRLNLNQFTLLGIILSLNTSGKSKLVTTADLRFYEINQSGVHVYVKLLFYALK